MDSARNFPFGELSHENRVILEGIANGIINWYLSGNPLQDGSSPLKGELDWLLDRLTLELDKRIVGFKADDFVYYVWKECGVG